MAKRTDNAPRTTAGWALLAGMLLFSGTGRAITASECVPDDVQASPEAFALTPDEIGWLRANPVLRVGADPHWPPLSYFNEKGKLEGIDADILAILQEKLGVRFEVVHAASWSELETMLRERKVDFTVGTAQDPRREAYAHFTRSYLRFPVAIITRTDAPFLVSLQAIRGKKVAAPREHVTTVQIAKDFPDIHLLLTDNLESALRAVAAGKADAFIGGLTPASYVIKEAGLTNLKIAGLTDYRFYPRLAIRLDRPELASVLDRALTTIGQAERMRIVDRWIAVRFDREVDWRRFIRPIAIAASIALACIAFVVAWNHRLATELDARRKAEAALRESRESLQRANARLADLNAEKDHLLEMAAHDLNSPLTAVIMFCEIMRTDRLVTSPEGLSKLHDIQRNAERMSRLVRNLLNLRAIEQGTSRLQTEPFDPGALLDAVVDRYEHPAALKSILLHLHITTGPRDRVGADRDATDQILDNLLSNAIKFTPPGGKVTASVARSDHTIRFTVADTGPGIPESDRSKLFTKFARLSTRPTGGERSSGLGLSIVKKLAELMGGIVRYDPAPPPSTGSRFIVDLPAEKS